MHKQKAVIVAAVVVVALLVSFTLVAVAVVDCSTITALISACASFVSHGYPDPYPESPCCVAITGISRLSDSFENRLVVCRCLMACIATYNPNATAIATLPGYCGVSLGFTIDPNTDCEYLT